MEKFDRIFARVCEYLALYVCGTIALVMVLYVCTNVFFRYVLGIGGITGCYSYVGALLVPLIYLGLAYGWFKRAYIVLDIFQVKLKGRVLWGFQFAFLLITLVLFVFMILYGALLDTIDSYDVRSLVGEYGYQTPEWIWKVTIILGSLLLAARNTLDLVRMVRTGEIISADR